MNQRINPQEGSGIHLGLTDVNASFQPRIVLMTDNDTLQVQFYGNDTVTDINNLEYVKYCVTDGRGNESYGEITDTDNKSTLNIDSIINKSELNVRITMKTKNGIRKDFNMKDVKLNTGNFEMGAYIYLSNGNNPLAVSTAGGVATTNIKSNQKWAVTSDREWVKTTGIIEGNMTVSFTCEAGGSEIAQVVFTNNSGVTKTLEISRN